MFLYSFKYATIEYRCPEWWHFHSWRGYRHQRVAQENRRWYRDCEEDVRLRRRRNPTHMNAWGLIEGYPSIYKSKSWKHIFKCRKQWQKWQRS